MNKLYYVLTNYSGLVYNDHSFNQLYDTVMYIKMIFNHKYDNIQQFKDKREILLKDCVNEI